MKNLITLLLCSCALTGFSQKGFHIGVIGGPQFSSQLNQQDFDNADVRYDGVPVRSAFGLTFNYHFTDKLGLGTQLVLSYEGFRYHDALFQYFRKVTYFKVPLLFHVNSSSAKLVGGYFYIGPELNLLVAKDFSWAAGTSLKKTNQTDYHDYANLHKSFTVGGVIGFGIVFNILKGRLQINAGVRLDGDFTDTYRGKLIVADANPAFDSNKPVGSGNYPYRNLYGNSVAHFATNPETGKRSATYNVNGLAEIGFKFVIFRK